MKVLFITRKFPPATGGMENYLYDLITNYTGAKIVLKYGGSQKWLPFILVKFFFQAAFLLTKDSKIDLIYLGDGVLAPLGYLLKVFFGRKVVMTVHGKDLVFKKFFYQQMIVPFIRKIDSIIAISHSTFQDALAIGVDAKKIKVIPCGINPNKFIAPEDLALAKSNFASKYNLNFENRKILLTVGRLSNRKGQLWFIDQVMPLLDKNIIYLLVGPDGSDINDFRSLIGVKKITLGVQLNKLINKNNLNDQVFWLGKMPANDLNDLLSLADLSIMPNIPYLNDREGFGIVNIEAGLAGLPVIASELDGIPDSIINHVSGSLVESGNPEAFIEAISNWLSPNPPYHRKLIPDSIKQKYAWDVIIKANEQVFRESLSK